jgi:hypothetical protein
MDLARVAAVLSSRWTTGCLVKPKGQMARSPPWFGWSNAALSRGRQNTRWASGKGVVGNRWFQTCA